MADSETLCSSFFALEQMIFYMAHDETTLQLDSREVIQVHSALQGAVGAIIYFLTNVANTEVSICMEKYSINLLTQMFCFCKVYINGRQR